jgi:phage gpG-like protein
MTTKYLITVSHTARPSHKYYKCLRQASQWTSIVKTYNRDVAKQYTSQYEAETAVMDLSTMYPALHFTVVEKGA